MHMSGVRVNIVIETVGKQRVVRLEHEMDGHWRRASAPTARGVGRFFDSRDAGERYMRRVRL